MGSVLEAKSSSVSRGPTNLNELKLPMIEVMAVAEVAEFPWWWPLKHIRNYGYENNIFYFETGRRCPQKGRHALVGQKSTKNIWFGETKIICYSPAPLYLIRSDTSEHVRDKICVHTTSVLQETWCVNNDMEAKPDMLLHQWGTITENLALWFLFSKLYKAKLVKFFEVIYYCWRGKGVPSGLGTRLARDMDWDCR